MDAAPGLVMTDPRNLYIVVDSTEHIVTLRGSERRRLALIVKPDLSIECRFPRRSSIEVIERFVRSRKNWLQRTIRKVSLRPQPVARTYEQGSRQPFLGVEYGLSLRTANNVQVRLSQGELQLAYRKPASTTNVSRVLHHWYGRQAKRIFAERLSYCQQSFPRGPACKGMIVRKMKSRWGSCSSAGLITLNSRLVEYPLKVIDYVIFHELCHLVHFNHNAGFYQLLTDKMPDWQEQRALLS